MYVLAGTIRNFASRWVLALYGSGIIWSVYKVSCITLGNPQPTTIIILRNQKFHYHGNMLPTCDMLGYTTKLYTRNDMKMTKIKCRGTI